MKGAAVDVTFFTAPDGTAVTYPVLKTAAFSAYDFEGRSGALSTTVKTEWFNDSRNLTEGDKVQLVGFGTFEVRERGARTGKNPRTGEAIKIAASKVPAFKAGKALKDTVNK